MRKGVAEYTAHYGGNGTLNKSVSFRWYTHLDIDYSCFSMAGLAAPLYSDNTISSRMATLRVGPPLSTLASTGKLEPLRAVITESRSLISVNTTIDQDKNKNSQYLREPVGFAQCSSSLEQRENVNGQPPVSEQDSGATWAHLGSG